MNDESFPFCENKCESSCSSHGACLFDGKRAQCYCNSGFQGPSCELTDTNECSDKPCHWMAKCQNTYGSYRCQCHAGFEGDGYNCNDIDECSTDVADCPSNSECVNLPGTYMCNCSHGYIPKGTPVDKCVDVDECEQNRSLCGFKLCQNTEGSYKCVDECDDGYEYSNGRCFDVDECKLNSHLCATRASCHNTPGSYRCDCDDGFVGDGTTCVPLLDCTQNEQICDEHATCLYSQKSCVCQAGYIGDGHTCRDVDECATTNPCAEQGKDCVNVDGGYVCCDPKEDQTKCLRESGLFCAQSCGLHSVCFNRTCTCLPGYQGDPRVRCDDINECHHDNICPGAGQWCVNLAGGHVCCSPDSEYSECRGLDQVADDSDPKAIAISESDVKNLNGNENKAEADAFAQVKRPVGSVQQLEEGEFGTAEKIKKRRFRTKTVHIGKQLKTHSGGFVIIRRPKEKQPLNGTSGEFEFKEIPNCVNGKDSECPEHSVCYNNKCRCRLGFEWSRLYNRCEDINECLAPNPCPNTPKGVEAWCVNSIGGYHCCQPGMDMKECGGMSITEMEPTSPTEVGKKGNRNVNVISFGELRKTISKHIIFGRGRIPAQRQWGLELTGKGLSGGATGSDEGPNGEAPKPSVSTTLFTTVSIAPLEGPLVGPRLPNEIQNPTTNSNSPHPLTNKTLPVGSGLIVTPSVSNSAGQNSTNNGTFNSFNSTSGAFGFVAKPKSGKLSPNNFINPRNPFVIPASKFEFPEVPQDSEVEKEEEDKGGIKQEFRSRNHSFGSNKIVFGPSGKSFKQLPFILPPGIKFTPISIPKDIKSTSSRKGPKTAVLRTLNSTKHEFGIHLKPVKPEDSKESTDGSTVDTVASTTPKTQSEQSSTVNTMPTKVTTVPHNTTSSTTVPDIDIVGTNTTTNSIEEVIPQTPMPVDKVTLKSDEWVVEDDSGSKSSQIIQSQETLILSGKGGFQKSTKVPKTIETDSVSTEILDFSSTLSTTTPKESLSSTSLPDQESMNSSTDSGPLIASTNSVESSTSSSDSFMPSISTTTPVEQVTGVTTVPEAEEPSKSDGSFSNSLKSAEEPTTTKGELFSQSVTSTSDISNKSTTNSATTNGPRIADTNGAKRSKTDTPVTEVSLPESIGKAQSNLSTMTTNPLVPITSESTTTQSAAKKEQFSTKNSETTRTESTIAVTEQSHTSEHETTALPSKVKPGNAPNKFTAEANILITTEYRNSKNTETATEARKITKNSTNGSKTSSTATPKDRLDSEMSKPTTKSIAVQEVTVKSNETGTTTQTYTAFKNKGTKTLSSKMPQVDADKNTKSEATSDSLKVTTEASVTYVKSVTMSKAHVTEPIQVSKGTVSDSSLRKPTHSSVTQNPLNKGSMGQNQTKNTGSPGSHRIGNSEKSTINSKLEEKTTQPEVVREHTNESTIKPAEEVTADFESTTDKIIPTSITKPTTSSSSTYNKLTTQRNREEHEESSTKIPLTIDSVNARIKTTKNTINSNAESSRKEITVTPDSLTMSNKPKDTIHGLQKLSKIPKNDAVTSFRPALVTTEQSITVKAIDTTESIKESTVIAATEKSHEETVESRQEITPDKAKRKEVTNTTSTSTPTSNEELEFSRSSRLTTQNYKIPEAESSSSQTSSEEFMTTPEPTSTKPSFVDSTIHNLKTGQFAVLDTNVVSSTQGTDEIKASGESTTLSTETRFPSVTVDSEENEQIKLKIPEAESEEITESVNGFNAKSSKSTGNEQASSVHSSTTTLPTTGPKNVASTRVPIEDGNLTTTTLKVNIDISTTEETTNQRTTKKLKKASEKTGHVHKTLKNDIILTTVSPTVKENPTTDKPDNGNEELPKDQVDTSVSLKQTEKPVYTQKVITSEPEKDYKVTNKYTNIPDMVTSRPSKASKLPKKSTDTLEQTTNAQPQVTESGGSVSNVPLDVTQVPKNTFDEINMRTTNVKDRAEPNSKVTLKSVIKDHNEIVNQPFKVDLKSPGEDMSTTTTYATSETLNSSTDSFEGQSTESSITESFVTKASPRKVTDSFKTTNEDRINDKSATKDTKMNTPESTSGKSGTISSNETLSSPLSTTVENKHRKDEVTTLTPESEVGLELAANKFNNKTSRNQHKTSENSGKEFKGQPKKSTETLTTNSEVGLELTANGFENKKSSESSKAFEGNANKLKERPNINSKTLSPESEIGLELTGNGLKNPLSTEADQTLERDSNTPLSQSSHNYKIAVPSSEVGLELTGNGFNNPMPNEADKTFENGKSKSQSTERLITTNPSDSVENEVGLELTGHGLRPTNLQSFTQKPFDEPSKAKASTKQIQSPVTSTESSTRDFIPSKSLNTSKKKSGRIEQKSQSKTWRQGEQTVIVLPKGWQQVLWPDITKKVTTSNNPKLSTTETTVDLMVATKSPSSSEAYTMVTSAEALLTETTTVDDTDVGNEATLSPKVKPKNPAESETKMTKTTVPYVSKIPEITTIQTVDMTKIPTEGKVFSPDTTEDIKTSTSDSQGQTSNKVTIPTFTTTKVERGKPKNIEPNDFDATTESSQGSTTLEPMEVESVISTSTLTSVVSDTNTRGGKDESSVIPSSSTTESTNTTPKKTSAFLITKESFTERRDNRKTEAIPTQKPALPIENENTQSNVPFSNVSTTRESSETPRLTTKSEIITVKNQGVSTTESSAVETTTFDNGVNDKKSPKTNTEQGKHDIEEASTQANNVNFVVPSSEDKKQEKTESTTTIVTPNEEITQKTSTKLKVTSTRLEKTDEPDYLTIPEEEAFTETPMIRITKTIIKGVKTLIPNIFSTTENPTTEPALQPTVTEENPNPVKINKEEGTDKKQTTTLTKSNTESTTTISELTPQSIIKETLEPEESGKSDTVTTTKGLNQERQAVSQTGQSEETTEAIRTVAGSTSVTRKSHSERQGHIKEDDRERDKVTTSPKSFISVSKTPKSTKSSTLLTTESVTEAPEGVNNNPILSDKFTTNELKRPTTSPGLITSKGFTENPEKIVSEVTKSIKNIEVPVSTEITPEKEVTERTTKKTTPIPKTQPPEEDGSNVNSIKTDEEDVHNQKNGNTTTESLITTESTEFTQKPSIEVDEEFTESSEKEFNVPTSTLSSSLSTNVNKVNPKFIKTTEKPGSHDNDIFDKTTAKSSLSETEMTKLGSVTSRPFKTTSYKLVDQQVKTIQNVTQSTVPTTQTSAVNKTEYQIKGHTESVTEEPVNLDNSTLESTRSQGTTVYEKSKYTRKHNMIQSSTSEPEAVESTVTKMSTTKTVEVETMNTQQQETTMVNQASKLRINTEEPLETDKLEKEFPTPDLIETNKETPINEKEKSEGSEHTTTSSRTALSVTATTEQEQTKQPNELLPLVNATVVTENISVKNKTASSVHTSKEAVDNNSATTKSTSKSKASQLPNVGNENLESKASQQPNTQIPMPVTTDKENDGTTLESPWLTNSTKDTTTSGLKVETKSVTVQPEVVSKLPVKTGATTVPNQVNLKDDLSNPSDLTKPDTEGNARIINSDISTGTTKSVNPETSETTEETSVTKPAKVQNSSKPEADKNTAAKVNFESTTSTNEIDHDESNPEQKPVTNNIDKKFDVNDNTKTTVSVTDLPDDTVPKAVDNPSQTPNEQPEESLENGLEIFGADIQPINPDITGSNVTNAPDSSNKKHSEQPIETTVVAVTDATTNTTRSTSENDKLTSNTVAENVNTQSTPSTSTEKEIREVGLEIFGADVEKESRSSASKTDQAQPNFKDKNYGSESTTVMIKVVATAQKAGNVLGLTTEQPESPLTTTIETTTKQKNSKHSPRSETRFETLKTTSFKPESPADDTTVEISVTSKAKNKSTEATTMQTPPSKSGLTPTTDKYTSGVKKSTTASSSTTFSLASTQKPNNLASTLKPHKSSEEEGTDHKIPTKENLLSESVKATTHKPVNEVFDTITSTKNINSKTTASTWDSDKSIVKVTTTTTPEAFTAVTEEVSKPNMKPNTNSNNIINLSTKTPVLRTFKASKTVKFGSVSTTKHTVTNQKAPEMSLTHTASHTKVIESLEKNPNEANASYIATTEETESSQNPETATKVEYLETSSLKPMPSSSESYNLHSNVTKTKSDENEVDEVAATPLVNIVTKKSNVVTSRKSESTKRPSAFEKKVINVKPTSKFEKKTSEAFKTIPNATEPPKVESTFVNEIDLKAVETTLGKPNSKTAGTQETLYKTTITTKEGRATSTAKTPFKLDSKTNQKMLPEDRTIVQSPVFTSTTKPTNKHEINMFMYTPSKAGPNEGEVTMSPTSEETFSKVTQIVPNDTQRTNSIETSDEPLLWSRRPVTNEDLTSPSEKKESMSSESSKIRGNRHRTSSTTLSYKSKESTVLPVNPKNVNETTGNATPQSVKTSQRRIEETSEEPGKPSRERATSSRSKLPDDNPVTSTTHQLTTQNPVTGVEDSLLLVTSSKHNPGVATDTPTSFETVDKLMKSMVTTTKDALMSLSANMVHKTTQKVTEGFTVTPSASNNRAKEGHEQSTSTTFNPYEEANSVSTSNEIKNSKHEIEVTRIPNDVTKPIISKNKAEAKASDNAKRLFNVKPDVESTGSVGNKINNPDNTTESMFNKPSSIAQPLKSLSSTSKITVNKNSNKNNQKSEEDLIGLEISGLDVTPVSESLTSGTNSKSKTEHSTTTARSVHITSTKADFKPVRSSTTRPLNRETNESLISTLEPVVQKESTLQSNVEFESSGNKKSSSTTSSQNGLKISSSTLTSEQRTRPTTTETSEDIKHSNNERQKKEASAIIVVQLLLLKNPITLNHMVKVLLKQTSKQVIKEHQVTKHLNITQNPLQNLQWA
ncbi:unnamed protein product [Bursaphelenchus okinawaensis]|uniref:EGF-like domain-containing protein n=1 Tax=Bursaphelenchus okinawaensis TaxID=465554 RepID=A0A811KET4_9BILA|nr:unnamed protein product [Bursaphelenchus okinawaensis]CAG9103323.1 unnamed protein product [Bursaphelenchus okinawaensis]